MCRFEAPATPVSWEDVSDHVTAPAACPQPPPSPITPLQLNRTSEDCLYINIYAPESTVPQLLGLRLYKDPNCPAHREDCMFLNIYSPEDTVPQLLDYSPEDKVPQLLDYSPENMVTPLS